MNKVHNSQFSANSQNVEIRPPLTILLAAPRGFCAGVDRAVQIVELALEKYGAPVYVRHEIVHNRYVVDSLRAKGAIFVEELDEIPDNGAPVIFSAHGVPKSVPENAARLNMFFLDATCPLVTKPLLSTRSDAESPISSVPVLPPTDRPAYMPSA